MVFSSCSPPAVNWPSGVQPAYGASLLICGLPGLGPEPQLGLVCEATYALDGEKLLRVQPKGIGMKKSRMRERSGPPGREGCWRGASALSLSELNVALM